MTTPLLLLQRPSRLLTAQRRRETRDAENDTPATPARKMSKVLQNDSSLGVGGRVTVKKDKVTRKSQGVAFVLFLKKEDAQTCARSLNGQEMFGRRLKSSIAIDNGRSTEFIRRRNYPDKNKCYECGEEGHLSYACSKNALGNRDPPPKKERKRKKKEESAPDPERDEYFDSDDDYECKPKQPLPISQRNDADESDEDVEPDLETLSAAIRLTQEQVESEQNSQESEIRPVKKKIRPNSYFSDEEDVSD